MTGFFSFDICQLFNYGNNHLINDVIFVKTTLGNYDSIGVSCSSVPLETTIKNNRFEQTLQHKNV